MNRQMMEYVMFGRITPMKDLQQAADDAGTIAETIETLAKLMDKFHSVHGWELYKKIVDACPDAANLTISCAQPIYKLERAWTPPQD